MSYLVVGTPLTLEGIIVSPVLQWFYGTFTLISIVVIICAAVGALYAIEGNLNIYGTLLLISALIDSILFVIFLIWGKSCSTQHTNAPYHLVATVQCGLRDGLLLLCLTLLVIFKLVAVWVVNKCRRYVSSATNQDLMPFLRKHLQQEKVEESWMPEQRGYEPEPMMFTGNMAYRGAPMVPLTGVVSNSFSPPVVVTRQTPSVARVPIALVPAPASVALVPAPAVMPTAQVVSRSFTPPVVAGPVVPIPSMGQTVVTEPVVSRSFTPPVATIPNQPVPIPSMGPLAPVMPMSTGTTLGYGSISPPVASRSFTPPVATIPNQPVLAPAIVTGPMVPIPSTGPMVPVTSTPPVGILPPTETMPGYGMQGYGFNGS